MTAAAMAVAVATAAETAAMMMTIAVMGAVTRALERAMTTTKRVGTVSIRRSLSRICPFSAFKISWPMMGCFVKWEVNTIRVSN